MQNIANIPDDGAGHGATARRAPLIDLIAAIDEADLQNVDLPLEMPGLLEQFLDPEVQATLPAELRGPADAYLDGLPGYRAGEFARAGDAHRLRVAVWNGEAQVVSEEEIAELGLEPDDG